MGHAAYFVTPALPLFPAPSLTLLIQKASKKVRNANSRIFLICQVHGLNKRSKRVGQNAVFDLRKFRSGKKWDSLLGMLSDYSTNLFNRLVRVNLANLVVCPAPIRRPRFPILFCILIGRLLRVIM
jgi:hypothetical protein